jgi:indole-3-glycerol phosphate synthase
MTNRLDPILLQKTREVDALKAQIAEQPNHPIAHILRGNSGYHGKKDFKRALRTTSLAIIAEIKRKSPSKGVLAQIADPTELAKTYVSAGANALSVLTDEPFFAGSIQDLTQVATSLAKHAQPILRKDFIVDEIQIAEAIAIGADAILCIVAALGAKTKHILTAAKNMGIPALVEVHNHRELDLALHSGAEIIGINNRDLTTFSIDTKQSFTLINAIPQDIIRIAESGVDTPQLAQAYHRAGFDAVLIGEALVTSQHPDSFIRECQQ